MLPFPEQFGRQVDIFLPASIQDVDCASSRNCYICTLPLLLIWLPDDLHLIYNVLMSHPIDGWPFRYYIHIKQPSVPLFHGPFFQLVVRSTFTGCVNCLMLSFHSTISCDVHEIVFLGILC